MFIQLATTHHKPAILSITGSDPTGEAGVQADIMTITAMGGNAFAVVTSATVQDEKGVSSIYDMPEQVVTGQTQCIINTVHPHAVKVGMVRDIDTIVTLSNEIVALRNIVLAPGIVSSRGERLMSDDALRMWEHHLLPMARVLVLRCNEAEALLKMKISTDEDMVRAAKILARKGADAVLLRGAHHDKDMLKSLLYGKGRYGFFSTHNLEGWQRHGVSGAFSTAIAVGLAMTGDVVEAVTRAHEYMHSQVVYTVLPKKDVLGMREAESGYRPADLYNQLLTLIADNYREAHDVAFYADHLSISTRYLSSITEKVVGKSPKMIISEHLMQEAKKLLETSRMPVQEITYRLGFSSQAMFSRFFTTYAGCSPREYRKKL